MPEKLQKEFKNVIWVADVENKHKEIFKERCKENHRQRIKLERVERYKYLEGSCKNKELSAEKYVGIYWCY